MSDRTSRTSGGDLGGASERRARRAWEREPDSRRAATGGDLWERPKEPIRRCTAA